MDASLEGPGGPGGGGGVPTFCEIPFVVAVVEEREVNWSHESQVEPWNLWDAHRNTVWILYTEKVKRP